MYSEQSVIRGFPLAAEWPHVESGWGDGGAHCWQQGSHDTRLDVLITDLLVVIRSAAGVHGGRCHGIEGEDELLPVTHVGGLRVIPGDTCSRERERGGIIRLLADMGTQHADTCSSLDSIHIFNYTATQGSAN